MILKFRESTISRLERLRQREKEGSDTQDDGREREIVSEKNELLSHSYLSLTFFFTNVFPCCTIYSTLYACLSFWQQLLKEEISVMKDKIEHHPDVTRFAMENLELRGKDKITSRGFRIKIVPSRQRFFGSLVFNFIQIV